MAQQLLWTGMSLLNSARLVRHLVSLKKTKRCKKVKYQIMVVLFQRTNENECYAQNDGSCNSRLIHLHIILNSSLLIQVRLVRHSGRHPTFYSHPGGLPVTARPTRAHIKSKLNSLGSCVYVLITRRFPLKTDSWECNI